MPYDHDVVRLLATLALLTSCTVSVTFDDTEFACERGVCPDGFQCVEGLCTTGEEPFLGERRLITLDNAGGTETLVNFPIPIRIDSSLAAAIASDGSDLRFTTLAGAPIPHEIELWDPAGESLVWVVVEELLPNAVGAELLMITGEPGATDTQAPTQVWAEYHAVYHLADARDSSPSAFDGIDNGTTNAAGIVGPARNFDGTGQHIDLGMERPFVRAQPAMTVSAWARLDSALTESAVVFATSVDNMGATTNTSRFQLLINALGELEGDVRTEESGAAGQAIGPVLERDRWLHLAVVADLSVGSITLYLDGVAIVSEIPGTLGMQTADSNSTQTVIGHGEAFTVDAFFGDIDEVRLVHAARSQAWIDASRRAMAIGLETIGPAEPLR